MNHQQIKQALEFLRNSGLTQEQMISVVDDTAEVLEDLEGESDE